MTKIPGLIEAPPYCLLQNVIAVSAGSSNHKHEQSSLVTDSAARQLPHYCITLIVTWCGKGAFLQLAPKIRLTSRKPIPSILEYAAPGFIALEIHSVANDW